jgi:hypothetical protein
MLLPASLRACMKAKAAVRAASTVAPASICVSVQVCGKPARLAIDLISTLAAARFSMTGGSVLVSYACVSIC